jgi:hypothetical protein
MKETIVKEKSGEHFKATLVKGSHNKRSLKIKTIFGDWIDLFTNDYKITEYIQELTIIERWFKENE